MTDHELQAEEREVLISIYDGDDAFKEINPTTFQYKYGENESIKSFLLEISWGPNYPTEKPVVNLNVFYNRNLLQSVKDKICSVINDEADQWIGSAMTYTLFECLRERIEELLEEQTEVNTATADVAKIVIEDTPDEVVKAVKKEQLTKAQKRRAWDKAEIGKGGERPRGWDWVDLVKHLSQTGSQGAAAVQQSNDYS